MCHGVRLSRGEEGLERSNALIGSKRDHCVGKPRRHAETFREFDTHFICPRGKELEGEERLSVIDLLLHLVYDLHDAAGRSQKVVCNDEKPEPALNRIASRARRHIKHRATRQNSRVYAKVFENAYSPCTESVRERSQRSSSERSAGHPPQNA